MIRVRVVGNFTHNGKTLERGQELSLPAVHAGAAIRKGDLERIEDKPAKSKGKGRGRSRKDS